jgi:intracellular septation protein A
VATNRRYSTWDMFRDRAYLVDAALAPIVFVAVHAAVGLTAAAAAALGLAVAALVWRLARRQPARNAVFGLVGVVLAATIAVTTGSAEGYFWPRVLLNSAWSLAFVVSVAVGRPAIGLMSQAFYGIPPAWYGHERVRPAFSEVTLVWAGFFALKAAVYLLLILAGEAAVLAGVSFALGWPAFVLLLWLSFRYVAWRLRKLEAPAPPEAEAATAPRL